MQYDPRRVSDREVEEVLPDYFERQCAALVVVCQSVQSELIVTFQESVNKHSLRDSHIVALG